jgi:hypothetical protein
MSAKAKSVWETLSVIDCSGHTEEKNGFTYLSWAWAWRTLKELYPTARFDKLGVTSLADGSAMVSVRVWIQKEDGSVLEDVTEILPVLDFKNKSVQNPDCFSVNSAYQRCLVKCLAYMGLGMYIYQGEKSNPDSAISVHAGDGTQEDFDKTDLNSVAEVLITFMANRDLDSLRQFWAMNKQPLDHLEQFDPDNYKRVLDAFKAKAEKLKGDK